MSPAFQQRLLRQHGPLSLGFLTDLVCVIGRVKIAARRATVAQERHLSSLSGSTTTHASPWSRPAHLRLPIWVGPGRKCQDCGKEKFQDVNCTSYPK
eukprot:1160409-Pelagomonas_calceolata.AAC.4